MQQIFRRYRCTVLLFEVLADYFQLFDHALAQLVRAFQ